MGLNIWYLIQLVLQIILFPFKSQTNSIIVCIKYAIKMAGPPFNPH